MMVSQIIDARDTSGYMKNNRPCTVTAYDVRLSLCFIYNYTLTNSTT